MDKFRHMSYRDKMVTSFAIWFGTFSLGISCGFIGPSLVELSRKFDSDVATVSKVFSINQISCVLGAIASGIIFNRINRQLASSVFLIVMGLSTILLPHLPNLPLFFIVSIVTGLCWAGYDTSQVVWMIELWEGDAAAFIQTQHFSFAIGAFVSPMIVKCFLPEDSLETNGIAIGSDRVMTAAAQHSTSVIHASSTAPLLYVPFLLGGIVTITSGLFILVLYKIKRYERPGRGAEYKAEINSKHFEDQNLKFSEDRNPKLSEDRNSKFLEDQSSKSSRRILLLVLSSLFLGIYGGMEGSAFQFLATFSHFVKLHLSQRQAAGVLCAFSGAFTVGRGLGIAVVLRVRSEILMGWNLGVIVIGNYLLYFADESSAALHGGAIVLGLGYSTIFAGYFGFIEKYLEVGNVEGAILIAACSSISTIFPLIIGGTIEHTPFILLRTNIFAVFLGASIFISIWNIVRTKESRKQHYDNGLEDDDCWVPIMEHSD